MFVEEKLNDLNLKASGSLDADLQEELIQFYTFVDENPMAVRDVEMGVKDVDHDVRGRCNVLFYADGEESNNVKLYDWTWSRLMKRNSASMRRKTLQLNIYKYMLEKSGFIVIEMHTVIFHHTNKSGYVDIPIADLHFKKE